MVSGTVHSRRRCFPPMNPAKEVYGVRPIAQGFSDRHTKMACLIFYDFKPPCLLGLPGRRTPLVSFSCVAQFHNHLFERRLGLPFAPSPQVAAYPIANPFTHPFCASRRLGFVVVNLQHCARARTSALKVYDYVDFHFTPPSCITFSPCAMASASSFFAPSLASHPCRR